MGNDDTDERWWRIVNLKKGKKKDLSVFLMAPAAGLEPATFRLTVERSAN